MNETEKFARIHIDGPAQVQVAAPSPATESSSAEALSVRVFPEYRGADAEVRMRLAPADGQSYRMVAAIDLLDMLHIHDSGEDYLDESATVALDLRLARLGLATATAITGPLRLRLADLIPVVESTTPRASRYSSITLCLYLIAWLLQADAQAEDIDDVLAGTVDPWIDAFEPKEGWSGAARGTLRWLLSRRLFMTHKRKLRAAKLNRFPNVRAKLVDVLLRIMADPRHASPRRMKRLQTIYTAIGLDAADIHSDIHRRSTGIPAIPRRTVGKTTLDTSLLRDMARSTEQARQMLADVFVADEPLAPAPATENDTVADILRLLAQKPEWSRQEVETLARDRGLTLGAMLERVNDLAFAKTDEGAVEDDGDVIYVDTDVAIATLGT